MIVIGEAVVDDAVTSAHFCCDVSTCHGACCTLSGGRGAPLQDQEILEIEKAFPAARQFLSEKSLLAIERQGLYEGGPGDFVTPCIEHRECVFVSFDGAIARCSLEMAFRQGLTGWPKPISCHLFPIRARTFGKMFLRYEEIEECSAGRERGTREGVRLGDFLKDPLTRALGKTWFDRFRSTLEKDITG
jgi:hypothetical protein